MNSGNDTGVDIDGMGELHLGLNDEIVYYNMCVY